MVVRAGRIGAIPSKPTLAASVRKRKLERLVEKEELKRIKLRLRGSTLGKRQCSLPVITLLESLSTAPG